MVVIDYGFIGVLLCFIVVFYMHNEYTKGICLGFIEILIGLLVDFVLHTVIGYALIAIGVLVIVLGCIGWWKNRHELR